MLRRYARPLWSVSGHSRLSLELATYSTRACPDLRILFCGSDDFSVTSLKALVRSKESDGSAIQSIDVLCRPPKKTGRGLKHVREVPVVNAADKLRLPVHKIDTFKGWDFPDGLNINLIVAVSFGLLIPARLIQAATYGGLNVHPSLLPDFRGAAPIEHAIFEGCTETGVSLQTLHPTKFDHGALLRQERSTIDPHAEHLATIKSRLADQGARLLVDGIESGDFLRPEQVVVEIPQAYSDGSPVQRRKAPKITPEDLHVNWSQWSADQISLREKVLGPLWSRFTNGTHGRAVETRIKWTGTFRKAVTEQNQQLCGPKWELDTKTGSLILPAAEHTAVAIDRFTIAGKSEKTAKEARAILKISDEADTKFA